MYLEKLFLENEGLIFAAFNKYFADNIDLCYKEELISCGKIGLWKACIDVNNGKYDKNKGEFSTYATWKIRGQMAIFIRENYLLPYKHVKYKIDWQLISLNKEKVGKDGKKTELGEFLIGNYDIEFEENDFEELFNSMKLTKEEIDIVNLLLEGYKIAEIATIKFVSRQMIYVRVRAIKEKYKRYKKIELKNVI